MNEWEVVGVIVVLVGLFFTIYKPVSKMIEAMTRLTVTIDSLNIQFTELKSDNAESHRRIWDHNEEQDKTLSNHETRISMIEKEKQHD